MVKIWVKNNFNKILNQIFVNFLDKIYLGIDNSLVMTNKMYVEYGCTFDLRSFPFDNQKCAMNFSMDSAKAKYIVLSPDEVVYQVRLKSQLIPYHHS